MKLYIVAIAGILGLAAGVVAADEAQQSYCDDIEQQVIDRGNLEGTIACFDPGTTDVQASESVANATELRCVCRHSKDGIVQYIPIASASN